MSKKDRDQAYTDLPESALTVTKEYIQTLWVGKKIRDAKVDVVSEINNFINPLWKAPTSGKNVGNVLHEILRKNFLSVSERKAKAAFRSAKCYANKEGQQAAKAAVSDNSSKERRA